MTTARAHVGVEVGDGLVARFGDTLVLVAAPSRYPQGTEQLLDAVETMASEAGSPGARIAVRLAGIIAGPGPVPPFGVVAPMEGAHVVLLHGPVWVEVTGPDGVERLSGAAAVTWVDRRLGSLGDKLTMGHGESPVSVDPRSDLRAGLVPGSGFVLTAAKGGRDPETASGVGTARPLSDLSPVEAGERAPGTEPAPGAGAPVTETAWTDAGVADLVASGPEENDAGTIDLEATGRGTASREAELGPLALGLAEAGVADLQTTEPAATDVEDVRPGLAGPGPEDVTVFDLEVAGAEDIEVARAEPAAADPGPADLVPGDEAPGEAGTGEAGTGEAGTGEAGTGEAGTEPDEPTVAEPVAEPVVAELTAGEPESQSGAAASSGGQAADSRWSTGPAAQSATGPMGSLVSPDGMRIPLDRDYVLGREPESDPAVASRTATPVRLTDDDNLISRVQSYITVEGGQVTLKDAASANGTYVAAPGAPVWTRLGADPVVLPPTWSMRVGNRVFTYQTS